MTNRFPFVDWVSGFLDLLAKVRLERVSETLVANASTELNLIPVEAGVRVTFLSPFECMLAATGCDKLFIPKPAL